MQQPVEKRRWIFVVIGAFTTMVAIAFARMSYGVILPYMRDSLSLTYKQAGLLGTITSLGYLSLILVAGIVSVKWGGKRTILSGLSCTTVGFLGLIFTINYPMAMLFMLLLGVGTAFTFTTLISTVTAFFPNKRGLVIGLMTSGIGVGSLLTGLFVPMLGEVFPATGWRITWGLFFLVGILTTVLVAIFIKDPPSLSQAKRRDEQMSRSDLMKIYKNPRIISLGIIYGIVGLMTLAQSIFIMSFMLEYGIKPALAGQLVALYGIISIFSSPIWGAISDRIGRNNATIITISVTFISMTIVLFNQSVFGFALHMILLSSTVNGLFTLVQTASMDQVNDEREMPIAFSYVTFYFAAGQLIGPMVAGWLIEDFGGFIGAFVMLSVIVAIGIIITLRLRITEKARSDAHVANM